MIAAIVASWIAVVLCVSVWAVIRPRTPHALGPRTLHALGPRARIVVLRPCAGTEPHLLAALRSTRHAGPAAVVRLLVADFADPAWRDARAAAASLAAVAEDTRVIVTGARGPNRKADQLARALARTPPAADQVVVVADSDVLLDAETLAAVVDPVALGVLDACWAPPIEIAPITTGDRLSKALLEASLHAFPLLSALHPHGLVGKLFAVRRDALEAVGGFESLVPFLGEDIELGRRLHGADFKVGVASTCACSLAAGRSMKSVLDRYARWLTVIRAQRPWLLPSYPLLFCAAPLQILLAVAAVASEGWLAALTLLLALAARALVAVFARERAQQPGGVLLWALGADLLLLAAFVRALTSRQICWRGIALATRGPNIALAEKEPAVEGLAEEGLAQGREGR